MIHFSFIGFKCDQYGWAGLDVSYIQNVENNEYK